MGCIQSKNNVFKFESKNSDFKAATKFFSAYELSLLQKLYNDVAQRSDSLQLTKESFLAIFPFSGLWGNRVFHEFDTYNQNAIHFEQFIIGLRKYLLKFTNFNFQIEKVVRCGKEQQIRNLFDEYDIDQDGYINTNDFRTMLYNYPKESLKRIFNDKEFIAGAKILQSIKLDQGTKEILMEQNQISLNDIQIEHDEIPKEVTNDEMILKQKGIDRNIKYQNKDEKQNLVQNQQKQQFSLVIGTQKIDIALEKQRKNSISIISEQFDAVSDTELQNQDSIFMDTKLRYQDSTSSMGTNMVFGGDPSKKGGVLVKHANLNFLTKRYVKYIQHKYKTEKLSFEDFNKWVSKHDILLQLQSETYHEEYWKYNDKDPLYLNKKIDQCGYLNKFSRKNKQKIKKYWYELRDLFLYYYKNKQDYDKHLPPSGLIYLGGLLIEKRIQLNKDDQKYKYGIEIYHKDRNYRTKQLYCENEYELVKWMNCFQKFDRTYPEKHYSTMEKIGKGGYSTVYRCIDKTTHEEFALKAIEKIKLDDNQKQELDNETMIMKILNHPGIVKFHETIETTTHIYLIMELFKGGDLLQYIQKFNFLEEYEASRIFKYIVETIIYLHNAGIVHRDLKPENILLTMDQQKNTVKFTKIIDFGFAIFKKNKYANEVEYDEEKIYGTPNYVAPEVFKGKAASFESDIFSLGVILYAMLRGNLPFNDNSLDGIITKTLAGDYDLEDEHWLNVSPQARNLIQQILQYDPKKRIQINKILEHDWLKNREELSKYIGINRNKDKI